MNGLHIEREPGLDLWHGTKGSPEHYITVSLDRTMPDTTAVCRQAYKKISSLLEKEGLRVVQERIFGSLNHQAAVLAGRQQAFEGNRACLEQPVTFIQGHPLWGEGIAGIQIHAIRPLKTDIVLPIMENGQIVGKAWKRSETTIYWYQNTHGFTDPASKSLSPKDQSEQMFLRAESLLRAQGLDYQAVVRTWIYLSNILSWYDGFNEVRNRLYRQWGLMPDPAKNAPLRLPASTGIRGDNPLAAACVMDFLAIAGTHAPKVLQLTNPKQKDAFGYQKAFSRGAFVQGRDFRHIQISGTAAIDERGDSLFPGDARQQVQHTLEVVDALIEPCGARLADISGATFFLKSASDATICREVLRHNSLEHMPAVWVVGDVCRGELLFEMDAIAVGPFA